MTECFCLVCNKMRKVKEEKFVKPEFAEVQTAEWRFYLVCGHRASLKLTNHFDD